jgi:hypothetical protein
MDMDTFSLNKQTKDITLFSRNFVDPINPTMQGKPLELFKFKAEENIHEPEENIAEPNILTFIRFLKLSKICEEPLETGDISTNSMTSINRNITSRTISLDPTIRINPDLHQPGPGIDSFALSTQDQAMDSFLVTNQNQAMSSFPLSTKDQAMNSFPLSTHDQAMHSFPLSTLDQAMNSFTITSQNQAKISRHDPSTGFPPHGSSTSKGFPPRF